MSIEDWSDDYPQVGPQYKLRQMAIADAVAAERERCVNVVKEWLHVPTLLLRIGEATAQERRTVFSVLSAILVAIERGERE